MRKSKFSESQVLSLLKQAESSVPVADICQANGVSNSRFIGLLIRFSRAALDFEKCFQPKNLHNIS